MKRLKRRNVARASFRTNKYYKKIIMRLSAIVNHIKQIGKGSAWMYFRRLRDMREDRDLKQEQIAQILGIQQTVYSRYERGFQTIPLEYLLTLADYYGTSTDYLLGRTNIPDPYPPKKTNLRLYFDLKLVKVTGSRGLRPLAGFQRAAPFGIKNSQKKRVNPQKSC